MEERRESAEYAEEDQDKGYGGRSACLVWPASQRQMEYGPGHQPDDHRHDDLAGERTDRVAPLQPVLTAELASATVVNKR